MLGEHQNHQLDVHAEFDRRSTGWIIFETAGKNWTQKQKIDMIGNYYMRPTYGSGYEMGDKEA